MNVSDRMSIGIDVGTTTVSAAVLNLTTGEPEETVTTPGNAAILSPHPWEKTQNPETLYRLVKELLDCLLKKYPRTSSIGFTGQMHGILFTDADGEALSPLYTWQDERAGVGSPSSCDLIREKTGYRIAQGYGLATAYDLLRHGQIPSSAAGLATVMDWAVMRFTGRKTALMHTSNAASLGLFRLTEGQFDREAAAGLGLDAFLPEVTGRCETAGSYRGIPVSAAIGDNQAAFLGSVRDPGTCALVNIGTGSQISLTTDCTEACGGDIELRPYLGGSFLSSGSALCGGRAYALLERFFRRYAGLCGGASGEQYDVLNRLALDGLRTGKTMDVCTAFCGTRTDPMKTGSFCGVTEENFTPEAMAAGLTLGMAEELYGLFRQMPREHVRTLIASGNAVRKNPALRLALEQVFGMEVWIPKRKEEAACGAAMFGAAAAGLAPMNELSGRIALRKAETEETHGSD